MWKLTVCIMCLLFAAATAHAQEMWYECAESSAVDYEISASKFIPSTDAVNVSIDLADVTNVAEPENISSDDTTVETPAAVPGK